MSVLEKYKVRFHLHDILKIKTMSSTDGWLSAYVTSTSYNSSIAMDVLIAACDYSIAGGEEITPMDTEEMYMAEIGEKSTRIYRDIDVWGAGGATPDFELPTSDFREIVLGWKDYIESEKNKKK
ncbi:MAG: hypothetical protein GQ574_27510 [Crocinitomix sp.]|nr:hypothetical protein [Crocinitomix sp.]